MLCEIRKEMKHGAFNVIPEADEKVFDGNNRHPHDPGELACRNHK